jgi:hypothetical protein
MESKNGIEGQSECVREREVRMLMLMIWDVWREKQVYTYTLDNMSSMLSVCVFDCQCIVVVLSGLASEEDAV